MRRVRKEIIAVLVTLAVLWLSAAFVTTGDAVELIRARVIVEHVGRPADALVLAVQEERRLAMESLGGGTAAHRAALAAQRARTDSAIAAVRAHARRADVRLSATGAVRERTDEMLARLAAVDATRAAIDSGRTGRTNAALAYSDVIDAALDVHAAAWPRWNSGLAADGDALVALSRAREVLAAEDALVAGALAAGGLTSAERTRFAELSALGRHLAADAAAELPDADRARYQRLAGGPAFERLRALEDLLTRTTADPAAWGAAVVPVLAGLREVVARGAEESLARATPASIGVIVRFGLTTGLGLVTFVGAILVSIRTARTVRRQLDELGEAALGEAQTHRGELDLMLDLALRNQRLVRRLIRLLDRMERREADADTLADLFRVDQFATRIRRNVEETVTLLGAIPGRRWRRPVPLIDVIRGALAEVEDYPRVTTSSIGPASLAGPAVTDVTHLLAELIENATSFSPPLTPVSVSGERRPDGFAVLVSDEGAGMSDVDLVEANRSLARRPDPQPAGNAGRGLHVVGRLAGRHNISVELQSREGGGTTAFVLIPSYLVVEPDAMPPAGLDTPTDELPVTEPPAADSPAAAGPPVAVDERPELPKRVPMASLTVGERDGEAS